MASILSNCFIEINKNLKILFYYTILTFYSLINLELKNDKKFLFNTQKIVITDLNKYRCKKVIKVRAISKIILYKN